LELENPRFDQKLYILVSITVVVLEMLELKDFWEFIHYIIDVRLDLKLFSQTLFVVLGGFRVKYL
jgi:hypothetical protein